jgi:hypothetical protein
MSAQIRHNCWLGHWGDCFFLLACFDPCIVWARPNRIIPDFTTSLRLCYFLPSLIAEELSLYYLYLATVQDFFLRSWCLNPAQCPWPSCSKIIHSPTSFQQLWNEYSIEEGRSKTTIWTRDQSKLHDLPGGQIWIKGEEMGTREHL